MATRNSKLRNSSDDEASKLEESAYIQDNKDNIVQFKRTLLNTSSIVPELAITLKEAKKRGDLLKKFVDEMMIPGIDYGHVPGISKPTLLKPGAEKLCDAYGFSKRLEITNRLEDWYRGVFHYEVRVTLICKCSGLIEAEGIGSCNSKETAYRDYNGHDVVNTIIKMAKKRALVDAVLLATRSSDIFTQDVDEMEWLLSKGQKGSGNETVLVSRNQLSFMFFIVEQKGIPIDDVKAAMQKRYDVTESKKLSRQQACDFIDYLKSLNQIDEKQSKKLPTIM